MTDLREHAPVPEGERMQHSPLPWRTRPSLIGRTTEVVDAAGRSINDWSDEERDANREFAIHADVGGSATVSYVGDSATVRDVGGSATLDDSAKAHLVKV